ncbi:MAG: hypothetical protein E7480_04635 [Ruminococcaceae bacterium]|nr:hypothetical protein [Oscillospiraceae bacterium]
MGYDKNGLSVFWFWNDEMEESEVQRQLEEMSKKGVYEAVIHARIGLITEYLSEKWFSCFQRAVETAERLDMAIWIYDEKNFPSGYADGKVLAENPDYCGKNLKRVIAADEIENFFKNDERKNFVALYDTQNKCTVTDYEQAQSYKKDGTVLFKIGYTYWKVAFDEHYYIDVLNINAAKSFIANTHEEYFKRFGKYFGNVIKGFFSDEAGMYQNLKCFKGMFDNEADYDTVAWTHGFDKYFEEKNKYSIIPFLDCLWQKGNDSAKVRNDYYNTVCQLYKEAFLEPQKDFCHTHNVEFIGHLHMEDYLRYNITTQGNLFEALSVLDYTGVDRITYSPYMMTEKLVSSVAHMYGKEIVMSESFACAGWEFTHKDLKRWTDFQYVRGVNKTLVHAFFYSLRDDRKNDCPPSYFEGNKYWNEFESYSDYVLNLSKLLSGGTHIADVAIYYPLETANALFDPVSSAPVDELQQFIDKVAFCLFENQQDFDFIDSKTLIKSKIVNKRLETGNEGYAAIIIPSALYMNIEAVKKLLECAQNNVKVIFLKELPENSLNECEKEEYKALLQKLTDSENVYFLDEHNVFCQYTFVPDFEKLSKILYSDMQKDIFIPTQDRDIKVLHRKKDEKDIYFTVNESSRRYSGKISFKTDKALKLLDLHTMEQTELNSDIQNGYSTVQIEIEPYSSVMIVSE